MSHSRKHYSRGINWELLFIMSLSLNTVGKIYGLDQLWFLHLYTRRIPMFAAIMFICLIFFFSSYRYFKFTLYKIISLITTFHTCVLDFAPVYDPSLTNLLWRESFVWGTVLIMKPILSSNL